MMRRWTRIGLRQFRQLLVEHGKLTCGRTRTTRVDEVFIDTPDMQVFNAGAALLCRSAPRHPEATLILHSLADAGPLARAVQVRQPWDRAPATDAHLVLPEGEVASHLGHAAIGGPLAIRFAVRRTFGHFRAADAKGRSLRVTVDEISGDAVGAPVLELALAAGAYGKRRAQRLLKKLERRLDMAPIAGTALARVYAAAGHQPRPAPTPRAPLAPDMPLTTAAGRIIKAHALEMLAAAPAARLGLDAKGVHDMRVAARRARCALRVFATALPAAAADLEPELRWLRDRLGAVRDQDVYIDRSWRFAEGLARRDAAALQPYVDRMLAARDRARRRMMTALTSRRCEDLLARLQAVADAAAAAAADTDVPRLRQGAEEILHQRLDTVQRRGERAGRRPTVRRLHRLRIACKTLRYTGEWLMPLYGDTFARYIRRVRRMQSLLGRHHDAALAVERLRRGARELAATHPLAPFILGQLAAARRQTQRETEAEFAEQWTSLNTAQAVRDFIRDFDGGA